MKIIRRASIKLLVRTNYRKSPLWLKHSINHIVFERWFQIKILDSSLSKIEYCLSNIKKIINITSQDVIFYSDLPVLTLTWPYGWPFCTYLDLAIWVSFLYLPWPGSMGDLYVLTLTWSSQTSDKNTNMASRFSCSTCFNLTDAFAQTLDNPPKKLIFPKYAL